MPPEIKKQRREVLDAVIDIIEESGIDAVSARSIAKRLGISTQPIYREFGDMPTLIAAAAERGYEIFADCVKGDATEQAVGYVMFAARRGNLYKFLFRSRRVSYSSLDDLSHKLLPSQDIIERLRGITGLSTEKVYRLHLYIWMALSGIADTAADNDMALSEAELKAFTVELSKALTQYYKSAKENEE